MKDIENEIAPHRRKKGKKHFSIGSKLTPEGFERTMKKHRERLEKELQWSGGYTKYEHLKDAKQALKDINKRKKGGSSSFWDDYCRDREYRIVDDRKL